MAVPKSERSRLRNARQIRQRSPRFGAKVNPAGALSAIALLSLVLVQASLGLIAQDSDAIVSGPLNHLVSWDTATAATSMHEIVFYSLACLIALHIAAVGWYRYSKSINLVRPMISGRMTAPDQIATQPQIA
jgi:cytochrome b